MNSNDVNILLRAAPQVVEDSRQLITGGVLVWDSRIAPDKTQAVFEDARARGASHIVSDVAGEGVVCAPDVGAVLASYAAETWPRQPDVMMGVTGTSGKTSVAWFAQQLLRGAGLTGASLGTLGVVRDDKVTDYTGYTSPTALQLHPRLQAFAEDGVTHAVMEVSSHALALKRCDGVRFTAAGFTNFSQDHLDYHGTMEAYFNAKMRLFSELLPEGRVGVVNMGREALWPVASVLKQRGCSVLSVGTGGAELVVSVEDSGPWGMDVVVKYDAVPVQLRLPLLGDFQAENVAMALGLLVGSGVPWETLKRALPLVTSVAGRMEIVTGGDAAAPAVVVDYAHKPEALEKALAALRSQTTGKLWCVFGCGGNRDAGKRPLMGEIAGRLADHVVVTDDNPRFEEAATIRAAVMAGVGRTEGVWEIGDRREAMAFAIDTAGPDDVILVAGKGHEDGQIVKGEVLPFDDRVVVREILG